MKQLLLFISVIFLVSFGTAWASGCNNGKGTEVSPSKPDTSFCVGIYRDGFDGEVKYGEMQRVVQDVYGWANSDSSGQRKWVKDTTYLIIHQIPIQDSLMSKKYNTPIFDSSGKRNTIPLIYVYSKTYVRDGWTGTKQAFEELKSLKR